MQSDRTKVVMALLQGQMFHILYVSSRSVVQRLLIINNASSKARYIETADKSISKDCMFAFPRPL